MQILLLNILKQYSTKLKVNKFITANISTQLLYDYDIKFEGTDESGNIIEEERIQFKEILGIGFSFKF